MTITLNATACINCGRCALVCPLHNFTSEPGAATATCPPPQFCAHCGHCVAVCPKACIRLDEADPHVLEPVHKLSLSQEQQDMLFRGRRSIRAYKKKPVPHDVINKALQQASYAPSASNKQPVTWLLVEEPNALRALVADTVEWLRSTADKRYTNYIEAYEKGEERILRGAPQAIFACTPKKWLWGKHDASAALSYLELALHAQGVGTCWTGFVINAGYANALPSLNLPEETVIHAGLMIGYPRFDYARIPARKPIRLTVI